jgi:hypothetical protein
MLVTCKGDRVEFPLLQGAPNLNGQKYTTLRTPVHFFTELPQIACIMKNSNANWKEGDLTRLAQLIAFGIGVNPRKIDAALKRLNNGEIFYGSNTDSNHEASVNSFSVARLAQSLEHELMLSFREVNNEMIRKITDPVTQAVSVNLIADVDWIFPSVVLAWFH